MRIVFLILLNLLTVISASQNLIKNGSIENLDSCIIGRNGVIGNPIPLATHIFNLKGTPDVLNECSGVSNTVPANYQIDIPLNYIGYQYARSGKGCISFGIDTSPTSNTSLSLEIVSLMLSNNLILNKKYCLRFFVVKCENSRFSTDIIEAALSSDSLLSMTDSINYESIIINPNNSFLSDTLNWLQITDTIIATGFEKYLHIGRFHKISSSNIKLVSNTTSVFQDLLFYYLDDIALWPCDTIAPIADAGNDTIICKGDSVLLGTHNYNDHFYSWWHDSTVWFHGNTQIQRDEHIGRIWVKPESSKWYYLQATDFKYDKTRDSVFISVKPCAYTKEDTSICNGESVSLAIVDSFFNSFVWSPTTFLNDPNSANPIASPKHSIMYYVTATDTMGGSIYDSIFIHIRTCTPAISDTTICKGDEIIIGNNDSLYTSFLWSPIKYLNDPYSATPLASPPYNITYYVNSIDTMGNSDSDTVKIIVEDCGYLPDLIIPNAFTPNMDGLNDVFTYGNDEYWIIKTLIYNRWGELIFEGKTNQRWHGTHKDKKVSEDVYIYHISARAIGKDEERIYKGSVVIYY